MQFTDGASILSAVLSGFGAADLTLKRGTAVSVVGEYRGGIS
jgi:hypothetical protein